MFACVRGIDLPLEINDVSAQSIELCLQRGEMSGGMGLEIAHVCAEAIELPL